MKVVILAGGFGTRISEESHLKPKPMVEIGDKPILWHIMKIYSHYGFNDFIVCLGYKGHMIKQFFADYYLHMSDVTFDFRDNNKMEIHQNVAEPWRVTLVDTGMNTQTGGRLAKVKKYIGDERFMLTYGDGVCDIDLNKLLEFHKLHAKALTITAIQPGGRFGVLDFEEGSDELRGFTEKAKEDGGWVNGGFMIMEPEVFDYLGDDSCILEQEPIKNLTKDGKTCAYKHEGFWQCMDTQRDKNLLTALWEKGAAPWKLW